MSFLNIIIIIFLFKLTNNKIFKSIVWGESKEIWLRLKKLIFWKKYQYDLADLWCAVSDTGEVQWYVEIYVPGGVTIPKLSITYNGDTSQNVLLYDYKDGSSWTTPMIITNLQYQFQVVIQVYILKKLIQFQV